MKLETCPTCGTRKQHIQPEVTNGLQDIFYICGQSVTYNVENPEEIEETGDCKNKFDWTHVYLEYGEEFDNSAKLVDSRFFGWLEYDLYKSIHSLKWFNDNVGKNFLDKEFLDEYFQNKELYIKKKRDEKGKLKSDEEEISFVSDAHVIIKKSYTGDLWLGDVDVLQVKKYIKGGVEKIIYKILSSEEDSTKIDGYVIETNPTDGSDKSVEFYDREFIEIIIKHEME